MRLRVPYFKQNLSYICGPVALQMIFAYFGIRKAREELIKECKTSKKIGTTHKNLIDVLQKNGLYVHSHDDTILEEVENFVRSGVPVIVNYRELSEGEGHYAIITGFNWRYVFLNDPWYGADYRIRKHVFVANWYGYHESMDRRWILAVSDEPISNEDPKKIRRVLFKDWTRSRHWWHLFLRHRHLE